MSLQLTDPSLFGERVTNIRQPSDRKQQSSDDKCKRCGARERLKTVGKVITSTLSAIGICARCIAREAGLD